MKTRRFILVALLAALTMSLSAQQVTTLYFLENSPMRHTINPAFQPVSNGYINFSPLGWTVFGVGNNSLTLSDLVYVDKNINSPTYGKTITALHPDGGDRIKLLNTLRSSTYFSNDITFSLLNFGFRVKENGYVMIGLNERISAGSTLPKSMFQFLLNSTSGGSATALNTFNLSGLSLGLNAYTEIGGGYSHRINDQWTVGGKLKVLLGQLYAGTNMKQMGIDGNTQAWHLYGDANIDVAGPLNFEKVQQVVNGRTIADVIDDFEKGTVNFNDILDYQTDGKIDPKKLVKLMNPSGYGAAIDLGFTYKPIKQLQLSVALNDLGFIYWTRSQRSNCTVDTTFTCVGEFDYGDPAFHNPDGSFSSQLLMDSVESNLKGLLNGFKLGQKSNGMAKMTTARLNVGLDANFWDNRIGLGIVSATRLYNARLYEEVTLGFAFRPCNWFNIAASYSLLENGKYSNIGAGLSFMPYDGINLTLIMDYIPTSYAGMNVKGQKMYVVPDKTKMFNVALGFSIVWGTNLRDKDKDGVKDKFDLCPNTPRGVQVDENGCPLDEDHDGVPDYLDKCLGTPAGAIGQVDSLGCEKDTDGDQVPDWRDKCPDTPKEAWGQVDSLGCPIDTDGDGVPDYKDLCPGTPSAAYGKIDATGCPLDTDGDGVPDYMDECPGTPSAAYGKINEKGCPIDTDGDGVPDYLDECPDTKTEAIGHTDAKGCDLDTDGDGVPDYKDECPTVAGLKENKGCPEIKREVRQLLNKAMQGIQFEAGKATIKSSSNQILDLIASIFIENSNYIVEVQGHTDNTGKAEVNKTLSDKRANAVRDYLINKGVPAERLTAVGYGQEMPIADNKTKAGRAKNRRVEFKISFEEIHYETVLDHADPQPEVVDSAAIVAPKDTAVVAK